MSLKLDNWNIMTLFGTYSFAVSPHVEPEGEKSLHAYNL